VPNTDGATQANSSSATVDLGPSELMKAYKKEYPTPTLTPEDEAIDGQLRMAKFKRQAEYAKTLTKKKD
jgi:hypothetical protein